MAADMAGFEDEKHRRWLNDDLLTATSMVDLFRHFHINDINAYTCWNTAKNARAVNYGTRIDYILADKKVRVCGGHMRQCEQLVDMNFFVDCHHMTDYTGSNHCPVVADLNTHRFASIPAER
jgi:AP endonuclease-2